MKNILKLATAFMLCLAPALLKAQIYVPDKVIPLPGDGGYDYLAIDEANNRLYVSHGTAVNVIDLATEKSIGMIGDMKGVHGIAIDNKLNRGFISDGRANAAVAFDLKTLKIIETIALTAVNGPDAIMYDPFSDRVFTFCGESNNAAVIDPKTMKQVGTVALAGGPEFAVSDGKGRIYNNLEDKNSMDVIDAKTMKVLKNFSLNPCGGPTGLALDAQNKRLFTVCRENKGLSVVDETSGKVIATVPIGAGVDAVAYDPATKLIFASNGDGTTTIIKQKTADDYVVVQTLKTQVRAKTLALDTKTHKIYLSVADMVAGTRNAVPGTFKVLVFKME
ncbi:YncE family protein [Mucilaginibacter arboris]|uniref:YncE family protein n=1 Tax=Mucilaginibacter arboris TaxID=2682090 RepID=A0A7K1SVQ8_9SPHI|nr:YncE family protein [Mucilaginibacter arboris]MVN21422.1 YncE family protein [Mucilaginibacter arboris]